MGRRGRRSDWRATSFSLSPRPAVFTPVTLAFAIRLYLSSSPSRFLHSPFANLLPPLWLFPRLASQPQSESQWFSTGLYAPRVLVCFMLNERLYTFTRWGFPKGVSLAPTMLPPPYSVSPSSLSRAAELNCDREALLRLKRPGGSDPTKGENSHAHLRATPIARLSQPPEGAPDCHVTQRSTNRRSAYAVTLILILPPSPHPTRVLFSLHPRNPFVNHVPPLPFHTHSLTFLHAASVCASYSLTLYDIRAT